MHCRNILEVIFHDMTGAFTFLRVMTSAEVIPEPRGEESKNVKCVETKS